MKAGKKLSEITGNETLNTVAYDSLGNKVVIPAKFKVLNPTDNVENGIIIEDVGAGNNNTKGNQFIWIPIGKIKTTEGEKEITFGRYTYNHITQPQAASLCQNMYSSNNFTSYRGFGTANYKYNMVARPILYL